MITRRNFVINGIKALAGTVAACVAVKSQTVASLGMDRGPVIVEPSDDGGQIYRQSGQEVLRVSPAGDVGIGTPGYDPGPFNIVGDAMIYDCEADRFVPGNLGMPTSQRTVLHIVSDERMTDDNTT